MKTEIQDRLMALEADDVPNTPEVNAEIKRCYDALTLISAFEAQMEKAVKNLLENNAPTLMGQVILARDKLDDAVEMGSESVALELLDLSHNVDCALVEARDYVKGLPAPADATRPTK